MSVFVHAQGIKTIHAGGKQWQNYVHVVVESPQSRTDKVERNAPYWNFHFITYKYLVTITLWHSLSNHQLPVSNQGKHDSICEWQYATSIPCNQGLLLCFTTKYNAR